MVSPKPPRRRIFDDLAGDPDVEPMLGGYAPEEEPGEGGLPHHEEIGERADGDPELAGLDLDDVARNGERGEPVFDGARDLDPTTEAFDALPAPDPVAEEPVERPPSIRVVDELDEAYVEVRRRIATMAEEAGHEAEGIIDGARAEAERLVRAASEEAEAVVAEADRAVGEHLEEARREGERVREEAEAYSRDMRLAVDAYGTKHRREAEQEGRRIIAEAEERARATQEAAEEAARELERIALRKEEEMQAEAQMLEERRQRVLAGLREIASQLEEVPPSVIEAEFDVPRRSRAARRR